MTRVGVSGAAGRMGSTVCGAVEAAEGMDLTARVDPQLDTAIADVIDQCDVIVEFSTPETVVSNAAECLRNGVHVVIGATGFELREMQSIAEQSGTNARCFYAPNFAIGAVLMIKACREIAPHMPECEIIELHHDRKLDAPSGTAKRTADLITEAGGHPHEPIHSVRLPGLVAHQEVVFGGPGQTLTLRHDSLDRQSFMPGVILAVNKVADLDQPFTVGLEELL